ncbi:MAG: SEC-C domain-containing protein [Alkaliphilus sp.]|nr:SEC-C domain-containing protein [Alkaliphilus sp.]
MDLYKEWIEMASEANSKEEVQNFWEAYSTAEKKVYENILENPNETFVGVFKELVEKYEISNQLFMGFLDGINNSLLSPLDLEKITEDSEIKLEIDLEKLYFNMLVAKADYLYKLPQWDTIFDDRKRENIEKEYKKSKTVIKGDKIGRNDPCVCGSGNKYKKCCGKL